MHRFLFVLVFVVSAMWARSGSTASHVDVQPFGLADVQLLDSPFKRASERNAQYLLSLDPDRLLHNTRKHAGLAPKGERYGGWESRGIAGHTLGHYLTALSLQFAASGDRRFRERIDYIVAEMEEAQRAYGDGYVGALPPLELATLRGLKEGKVEIKDPFTFENGAWVPWYTQHKILAGLRDAWVLGGNTQAQEVALQLADWVDSITADLSPAQLQAMLSVEHGGMAEAMLDMHALTGNERYLATARRFEHDAVLAPLRSGRDELPGKHANTQIPKITGMARSYEVTGDGSHRAVAEEFWKRVVREHSWVIGGNSDGEHFFSPSKAGQHLSPATAETCNTYNMLKLTEHLFAWQPEVEYADYYERALYNHILASQEPRRGMFTYFMSLKPGHFRTHSTPFESFWCCVGSGMENHTKYAAGIYFRGGDDLYVNLFIPSVLTWNEKDFTLEQHTEYPISGKTRLIVKSAPTGAVRLRVRSPSWAADALKVAINGEPCAVDGSPGSYVAIERAWKTGDTVEIDIPMEVRREPLRGSSNQVAFVYGPAVLAGDLGPAPEGESIPYATEQAANFEVPGVPVPALKDVALQRVPGDDLVFRAQSLDDGKAVLLKPFWELHYRRYVVYWTVP